MSIQGVNQLARVEMWCARSWFEAKEAAVVALIKGNVTEHTRHMLDAEDWFAAMLVVNRLLVETESLWKPAGLGLGDGRTGRRNDRPAH